MSTERRKYVRNYFNRRRDFDVTWCTPQLASQPTVGLLPEWRAWLGPFDSDHTVTVGPDLGG